MAPNCSRSSTNEEGAILYDTNPTPYPIPFFRNTIPHPLILDSQSIRLWDTVATKARHLRKECRSRARRRGRRRGEQACARRCRSRAGRFVVDGERRLGRITSASGGEGEVRPARSAPLLAAAMDTVVPPPPPAGLAAPRPS